jgi:hypothetical protein
MLCKPRWNAATKSSDLNDDAEPRKPIAGMVGCRARAPTSHAAAPDFQCGGPEVGPRLTPTIRAAYDAGRGYAFFIALA